MIVKEQVGVEPEDFVTARLVISTGDQIGVGVALYRSHTGKGDAFMLIAINDEIQLYSIPLAGSAIEIPEKTNDAADRLRMGSIKVGDKYGCNVVAFSPLGDFCVVGCENGKVVIYKIIYDLIDGRPQAVMFEKLAECEFGHDAAVSSVSFHPRGLAVLSSAKDGTARLWEVKTGSELFRLNCSIAPIHPTKVVAKPKKNARPQKILVRGCAFGDLEGKIIYTVASERRGAAFLTRWTLVKPRQRGPNPNGQTSQSSPFTYQENSRVVCSDNPVAAVSMSGDGSQMALGAVDGTIVLFDVSRMQPVKKFFEVHDLPVTCIAARPVPSVLSLPGEAVEGVVFNCISASADSKLAHLTCQRRARPLKKTSPTTEKNKEGGIFFLLIQVLFLILMYFIVMESWNLCQLELRALVMFPRGDSRDILETAYGCVLHTALWAPSSRPGILVPPH